MLAALDQAGAAVAAVTVARPSLDDVYLRHVGRRFAEDHRTGGDPMIADTWWMTHRQLKALLRQPAVLVITLVQPMVWLFLFGNLFRRVVELPGFGAASYLDYLVPGVVVMNAVSANMWAGMGAIDEIERGTLNRFLVTPVSRAAIMNANVIVQALSTAVPVGRSSCCWPGRRARLPGRRGRAGGAGASPRCCSAPSSAHCPMCSA